MAGAPPKAWPPDSSPTARTLAALFAGCGITPASHVVIVGAGTSAGDFSAAARVYWTLKIAGHRELSLLEGGMAAWQQAGLPIESGRNAPPPTLALSGCVCRRAKSRSHGCRARGQTARCHSTRHALNQLFRGAREKPAGQARRPFAGCRAFGSCPEFRSGEQKIEAACPSSSNYMHCQINQS